MKGICTRAAALVILACLAAPAPGQGRPRRAALGINLPGLDALGRQYLDAGLPLPPTDAPLLLTQTGGRWSPGHDRDAEYVLGFRLGPAGSDEGERFLMGTQQGEAFNGDERAPATRPLARAHELPRVRFVREWESPRQPFTVNNWLALAVQCHLRGEDRLARQIFARGLTRAEKFARGLKPFGNDDWRDALAVTAWNHWMNVQCTAGTDRREVLARLEKLSAGFLSLDGPFERDYLASLRLALVPGTGAPESVEGLVDALVEHTGSSGIGSNDSNDPIYAQLQKLGFAAVPTLIAHLEDRRLTRSAMILDATAQTHPHCVAEVVSALIEDIAGAAAFPHGPYGQLLARPEDREVVAHWWAEASAVGEEAYMVERVFPPGWVSLRLVAARYPHRLGDLYARSLREQPERSCDDILQMVLSWAELSPEETRRLLEIGIASPNLARSMEALGALTQRDPAAADAALVEKLDRWPSDFTGPYGATHPESEVSHRVLCTESAAVWEAYERALRRASPGLRIEMLTRLTDDLGKLPSAIAARRLALLDRFLDDTAVRVIRREDEALGGRFEGYEATPAVRRLRVGNLVAWLVGEVLGVKSLSGAMQIHDEGWWAKRRAAARETIDRHARKE